eukprot:GHVP01002040.1.p1 GENE.GHVP01002040.1~~GHVP01002040.1.p1  ORF type:complete len:1378 (-),score=310.83 GHVP01002040.1:776-4909(-)
MVALRPELSSLSLTDLYIQLRDLPCVSKQQLTKNSIQVGDRNSITRPPLKNQKSEILNRSEETLSKGGHVLSIDETPNCVSSPSLFRYFDYYRKILSDSIQNIPMSIFEIRWINCPYSEEELLIEIYHLYQLELTDGEREGQEKEKSKKSHLKNKEFRTDRSQRKSMPFLAKFGTTDAVFSEMKNLYNQECSECYCIVADTSNCSVACVNGETTFLFKSDTIVSGDFCIAFRVIPNINSRPEFTLLYHGHTYFLTGREMTLKLRDLDVWGKQKNISPELEIRIKMDFVGPDEHRAETLPDEASKNLANSLDRKNTDVSDPGSSGQDVAKKKPSIFQSAINGVGALMKPRKSKSFISRIDKKVEILERYWKWIPKFDADFNYIIIRHNLPVSQSKVDEIFQITKCSRPEAILALKLSNNNFQRSLEFLQCIANNQDSKSLKFSHRAGAAASHQRNNHTVIKSIKNFLKGPSGKTKDPREVPHHAFVSPVSPLIRQFSSPAKHEGKSNRLFHSQMGISKDVVHIEIEKPLESLTETHGSLKLPKEETSSSFKLPVFGKDSSSPLFGRDGSFSSARSNSASFSNKALLATKPFPDQAPSVKTAPGKAPGLPPGKAPGLPPGKAPGLPPGKAPGKARGKAPGLPPGKAPGLPPGKAPGLPPGKAPGVVPGKAPGSPPGKVPGSPLSKSPGLPPGKAPGSPLSKSPGLPPGKAAGGSFFRKVPPGKAPFSFASTPNIKPPLGRKLFWKPVPEKNLGGTIWEEFLQDESDKKLFSMTDAALVKRVFDKSSRPSSNTRESLKSNQSCKIDGICLVGGSRAQNVGILLAGLSRSTEDWSWSLRILESKFSLDDIVLIGLVIPTPNEEDLLSAHLMSGGNIADLRIIPEQKMLPLRDSEVPRIRERVRALRLEAWLKNEVKHIRDHLCVLEMASDQVLRSHNLRIFLKAMLQWGNYVNFGFSGKEEELPTKGVAFSSLLRLGDFKSGVDNSITSLHFIAANLLATFPEAHFEELYEEMPQVTEAARIPVDEIDDLVSTVSEELIFLNEETTLYLESYKKNGGSERLLELQSSCKQILQEIIEEQQRVSCIVQKLCRYFASDSQSDNSSADSFFRAMDDFLKLFLKVINDILLHPEKYQFLLQEGGFIPTKRNRMRNRAGKFKINTNDDRMSLSDEEFVGSAEQAKHAPLKRGRTTDSRTLDVKKRSQTPQPSQSGSNLLNSCDQSDKNQSKNILRRGNTMGQGKIDTALKSPKSCYNGLNLLDSCDQSDKNQSKNILRRKKTINPGNTDTSLKSPKSCLEKSLPETPEKKMTERRRGTIKEKKKNKKEEMEKVTHEEKDLNSLLAPGLSLELKRDPTPSQKRARLDAPLSKPPPPRTNLAIPKNAQ